MSPITIITFHPHYLDDAARLYEHAYAVLSHEGKSGFDLSREIVAAQANRDSFIGVLAINELQEVIGLAWGYDTPAHNERITRLVARRMGQEWVENTFMVEAFAMHFEHHQNEDLARLLHDGLVKRVAENDYARMRIRVDVPRLDNLTETLQAQDWRRLQSLSHVVWMGKEL